MATYHFSARIIKRSQSKSAIAAAAYRAGDRYYDERLDKYYDYGNKSVSHSEIVAPDHAGEWAKDRETLWNTVQNKERQFWSNAQLARDLEIALPREFSLEENIALIRDFAQAQFVSKGMIADINIHEEKASDGEMNPHAHIMLTMKEVDEETGEFKSAKNRDWNKKSLLNEWREAWADSVNDAYGASGIEARVDHRSLIDQGIDREPEIHVGFASADIEQKGGYAERFERNEEIKERNRLLQMAKDAAKAVYDRFNQAVAWVKARDKEKTEDDIMREQAGYELNHRPPEITGQDKEFEH